MLIVAFGVSHHQGGPPAQPPSYIKYTRQSTDSSTTHSQHDMHCSIAAGSP